MVNVVSRGGGSVAPEADAAQSRAALRKQRGAQRAQLPKEHGAVHFSGIRCMVYVSVGEHLSEE